MTGPLDPAQDPDRFDATRAGVPAGPLDPRLDPDRHDPASDLPARPSRRGRGESLTDLLGTGSYADRTNPYVLLLGLLGVALFLGAAALVLSKLGP